MNTWTIYWILKLDVLGDTCITVCMFSLISIVASVCISLYWKQRKPYYERERKEDGSASEHFVEIKELFLSISKKCFIACIILFFVSFPLAMFLPTTQQACVIYVLPKIANNEHIQEIPNNVSKLMNEKLAEWIDDMKGTKVEVEIKPK